jgi:cytochrome c-type biogenesis protein
MEFGLASFGFALIAGLLSTLSPCVLPIVPILLGSGGHRQRCAPFSLAAGLVLSYAIVGTALAWVGTALAIDTSVFRHIGAIALGLFGIFLISSTLQNRFAMATASVGNAGTRLLSQMRSDGPWGLFGIGLVLGLVWSPCVGPTLGAAILVASQGSRLPQVALLMGIFGIGAAIPIVMLTLVSRQALLKMRGKLISVGSGGKALLGAAMVMIAALVVSGTEKPLASWLVEQSPPWLTSLTTRY